MKCDFCGSYCHPPKNPDVSYMTGKKNQIWVTFNCVNVATVFQCLFDSLLSFRAAPMKMS